jgi:hypothetical protein
MLPRGTTIAQRGSSHLATESVAPMPEVAELDVSFSRAAYIGGNFAHRRREEYAAPGTAE